MIQASTAYEPSVFQTEARALLLAATIAGSLGISGPTFLTDNEVLQKGQRQGSWLTLFCSGMLDPLWPVSFRLHLIRRRRSSIF